MIPYVPLCFQVLGSTTAYTIKVNIARYVQFLLDIRTLHLHVTLAAELALLCTRLAEAKTETELIVHSMEVIPILPRPPLLPYNYASLLSHTARSLNSDLCATLPYWIMTTATHSDTGAAATLWQMVGIVTKMLRREAHLKHGTWWRCMGPAYNAALSRSWHPKDTYRPESLTYTRQAGTPRIKGRPVAAQRLNPPD